MIAVGRRICVKSIHQLQHSCCTHRVISRKKGYENTPSPRVCSTGMEKSVIVNEYDRSCFQLEPQLILWVFCHATEFSECAVEFWKLILGNIVKRTLVNIGIANGFRFVGHRIEGNGRRPQGEPMACGSLLGSVTNRDWHRGEHFIHIRRLSLQLLSHMVSIWKNRLTTLARVINTLHCDNSGRTHQIAHVSVRAKACLGKSYVTKLSRIRDLDYASVKSGHQMTKTAADFLGSCHGGRNLVHKSKSVLQHRTQ